MLDKAHALTAAEAIDRLNTTTEGLTEAEAKTRLAVYGKNEIQEGKRRTPLSILLGQFTDFMILVLIGASIISYLLGEHVDSLVIIAIVAMNAAIGFFQEFRAEKAIETLKSLAPARAKVVRDGQLQNIDASSLVPGDIVVLEAGQVVPADVRLIESQSLRADESLLTGESVPIEKTAGVVLDEDTITAERKNMTFKGTSIVYGRGRGVVVATGSYTEFGRIARLMAASTAEKTPLQKRLVDFGKKITYVVLAISATLFLVGTLRGQDPYLMFLTAVSLAVAAIPEALPAVVSIALALGAREMASKNALIRHLPAVETLGSTTFICTDKTGTLTLNQMTVVEVAAGDSQLLHLAMAVNNDAHPAADGKLTGDPTEVALLNFLNDNNVDYQSLRARFERLSEIPFDSSRKLMSVVVKSDSSGFISFTKGSPEEVLKRCSAFIENNQVKALSEEKLSQLHEQVEYFASRGLRTLAFAYKPVEEPVCCESDLVFLGFVAMQDPLRPGIKESVLLCKRAGIKVAMVTGDHPATAVSIAREAHILDSGRVLTGKELSALPMNEYESIVESVFVYARVDPEQKLKIVNALKDRGHIVAMTGDGINDAPALKRADIGVAMGRAGTDVAREAADLVLLDDNFSTIVSAIRHGRKIDENIRKFIRYTMSSNIGEIISILFAPVFGMPIPLLPIHILWGNLVTDGLPGLAFSYEKEEPDIMERPPKRPDESIFARGLGWQMIWTGLLLGSLTLVSQALSLHWEEGVWRTIAFTTLCFGQLGNALAIRSDRQSVFRIGIFSNIPLTASIVLTILLQFLLIYIPFFNSIFKTVPLSVPQLALALLLSTVVFAAVEIEKIFIRRYNLYSTN